MSRSIRAEDLAVDDLPEWMRGRLDVVRRLNGRRARAGSEAWQYLAGIAVDESGLRAPHREVLRFLIGTTPGSSWPAGLIAHRCGVHPQTVRAIVRELEDWGWLHVASRPGKPASYTVLVPDDEPPDRVGQANHPGRRRDPAGDPDGSGVCVNHAHHPASSTHPPASSTHTTLRESRTKVRGGENRSDEVSTAGPEPRSLDTALVSARWSSILNQLEQRESAGRIPTLPALTRRRIADVLATVHPHPDTLTDSRDPAAAVLDAVERSSDAGTPLGVWTATCATLGLSRSDADRLVAVRHAERRDELDLAPVAVAADLEERLG